MNPLWPDVPDALKRCMRMWDLFGDFPLPTAAFQIRCPICRDHNSACIKDFRFHLKDKSHIKYRCDVVFKCITCSAVWSHGVVIPEAMSARHGYNKAYSWREARDIIEGNTRNEIYIYRADDPKDSNKWYKRTLVVRNMASLNRLLGWGGELFFIDLSHFDPADVTLLLEARKIAGPMNTTTRENIDGFVKMAGKPLFERRL